MILRFQKRLNETTASFRHVPASAIFPYSHPGAEFDVAEPVEGRGAVRQVHVQQSVGGHLPALVLVDDEQIRVAFGGGHARRPLDGAEVAQTHLRVRDHQRQLLHEVTSFLTEGNRMALWTLNQITNCIINLEMMRD